MSGEQNALPDLGEIVGDLRRRLEEIERRDAGTERALDLGDLYDVRVDALVDPARTLSDGDALVYDATDEQWVPGSANGEITFSYPGVLFNDVESPPWYPPADVTFTEIRVSLLDDATVDHEVEVYVDGVLFDSYVLPSGDKTMTDTISCPVLTTEPVTVKTVDVSDSDLSVQLMP